jgi:hypothetical protein
MKKIILSLIALSSVSAFATTGTLNCQLTTLDSAQETASLKIQFKSDAIVSVSIEGEDMGIAKKHKVSVDKYEVSVVAPDYTEVLELQYAENDFSKPSVMTGKIMIGTTIDDNGNDGDLLFSDISVSCSSIN